MPATPPPSRPANSLNGFLHRSARVISWPPSRTPGPPLAGPTGGGDSGDAPARMAHHSTGSGCGLAVAAGGGVGVGVCGGGGGDQGTAGTEGVEAEGAAAVVRGEQPAPAGVGDAVARTGLGQRVVDLRRCRLYAINLYNSHHI
jgi:hypothetical protein